MRPAHAGRKGKGHLIDIGVAEVTSLENYSKPGAVSRVNDPRRRGRGRSADSIS